MIMHCFYSNDVLTCVQDKVKQVINNNKDDGHHEGMPWWAWLLIAVAILLTVIAAVGAIVLRFSRRVHDSKANELPITTAPSTTSSDYHEEYACGQIAPSGPSYGYDLSGSQYYATKQSYTQSYPYGDKPAARNQRSPNRRAEALRSDSFYGSDGSSTSYAI